MARQISLSEHTIQGHLKSIFAKTTAHDRVTVLSRALGTRRKATRPPRTTVAVQVARETTVAGPTFAAGEAGPRQPTRL